MVENDSDQSDNASFEGLITGLIEDQYGIDNQFIDQITRKGLLANLVVSDESGSMHPASIGRKLSLSQNKTVRGDSICWIDNNSIDEFEMTFINKIKLFISYLNRTCYTSINDFEFHYAKYEQGSFYKRHKDQFKSDSGRKFSFITYLNEEWEDIDGGAILLYVGNETKSISPNGQKSVFFKSDELEHEVCPSDTKVRYSITGWLKSV